MKCRRSLVVLLMAATLIVSCGQSDSRKSSSAGTDTGEAKITFLELGSVTCIPCKQMQPVMKSIETKYAGQVKVIFHDVMKNKGVASQYRIKLIPTQVFLDQQGKELMRHEGFFAEAEIDKFLNAQGCVPATVKGP